MTHATHWIISGEPVLPWENGDFLKAYNANRIEIIESALDSDPVTEAIMVFISTQVDGKWEGTASTLLTELERIDCVTARVKKNNIWPRLHNQLTRHLKKTVTFLREKGIDVCFYRKSDARMISITKVNEKMEAQG